ncbi:MAG: hypothetical protein MRY49_00105 [Candidatus Pacebacteria bacterium]|nr:hypothetical protein [Candidatus Paceibacterota bacterium]
MKMTKFSFALSHIALSIVFIWFGILKFFGLSPANDLVAALLPLTIPLIPFSVFILILGAVEVLIGVLFLIPKMERGAIALLSFHVFTTILPLFMLPAIVWQSTLVPTLEGQYIIKNIVIVALAIGILVDLKKESRQ